MGMKLIVSLQKRGIPAIPSELFSFINLGNRPQVDAAVFIVAGTSGNDSRDDSEPSIENEEGLPPEIRRYFSSDAVGQSYVFSTGRAPRKPVQVVKKHTPAMKKAAMKKAALKKK